MHDTETGTCIAFDYGSHRIGVAVGEVFLKTATPLNTVNNTNGTPDWLAIDSLVEEWQPQALIVGWPLTLDDQEQAITSHVRGFIKKLQNRYKISVHKADERFSSMAAQAEIKAMRSSGQRKRKTSHADVDKIAAALILESWFSMGSQT